MISFELRHAAPGPVSRRSGRPVISGPSSGRPEARFGAGPQTMTWTARPGTPVGSYVMRLTVESARGARASTGGSGRSFPANRRHRSCACSASRPRAAQRSYAPGDLIELTILADARQADAADAPLRPGGGVHDEHRRDERGARREARHPSLGPYRGAPQQAAAARGRLADRRLHGAAHRQGRPRRLRAVRRCARRRSGRRGRLSSSPRTRGRRTTSTTRTATASGHVVRGR